MANTIIDNVGGSRPNLGVASEATLQALLDSVNRKGVGQQSQGQNQRIQETYNRAISQGTKDVGFFNKAVKATGTAAVNLGKELAFGGDRVSDFSDAVFGASSSISTLTRFIERQVDTFRELSSVGASFNNSMFDMMAASANSSMNMEEFARMIRTNSASFAGFGSSVTGGAKVFGEFSKQFRTGVGQRFFEMGFTIDEINESLIGYLDIEARRSSRNLRTDKQQQEAAAGYITSLDLLTKLTGKQRKEMADAMATQVQDAGVRSQLNRLQGKELENFRAGLAFIDTEMGPIGDGLKDLMDGVAQTDLGKALEVSLPGVGAFAQKMFAGGASMEEIIDKLGNEFGPELERQAASMDKAAIDDIRSKGGVNAALAEILDNAYRLNQQKMKDVKAAVEEQKKREKLTSAFGKFEQTIINIRKAFIDTFFELGESTGLFDALKDLGDAFLSLTGPSTNGLSKIVPGLKSMLGSALTFFTGMIKKFTNWIKEGNLQTYIDSLSKKFESFGEYISELGNRLEKESLWDIIKSEVTKGFGGLQDFWNGPTMTKLSNDISNWFKDLLFGKEIDVDPRTGPGEIKLERQGGLIKAITDGFSGLFGDDSVLSSLKNGISDILFGKEVENFEGPELIKKRQGGLFESISTGFKNMLSGNSSIVNAITGSFENIFNMAKNALYNVIGVEGGGEGSLSKWFDDTWKIVQTKFDNIIERIESTIESVKTAIGFGNGKSLTQWFDETWASVKSTMDGISTNISSAIELIKQAFGLGEGGSLGKWIDEQIAKFTKFVDDQRATASKWIDEQVTTLENKLRDFLGMTSGQSFANLVTQMLAEIRIQIGQVLSEIPGLGEAGKKMIVTATGDRARAELEDANASGNRSVVGSNIATQISEQEMKAASEERSWYNPAKWFGSDYTYEGQVAQERSEALKAQLEAEQNNNALGTNGFQNFGSKTYATLHGAEAVVPKNTPAGELLQAFYDLQNSSVKSSTATETPMPNIRPDTTQTTLIKKLDELNNSMLTVASLLEAGLGVQHKTMRSVKGLGMDYYKGIGR